MRLKTLELQGFKSFPDKTVLSFDHPLTAIVGPNGSGKSNISDAVRWVLGEQSVKSLRGGRMEDVIFGGALERRRQGFAQVSLTLDRCEEILPDGGDEVTVTRRYYRSGESEYFINDRQVRLRDVNELFMDTGLGQEGYALIGQGRIDEILSSKSTQRREIFEEAAGISHCRHQKEETQRKLDRTRENLLRITDKLEELELQREPLRLQAETAKKYLALREELKLLEISLWMEQIQEQREKGTKLRSDHQTALEQLNDCTRRADELYARAESLTEQQRQEEVRGEQLREELAETEEGLRSGQQQAALLRERVRNNEESAQRLEEELRENARREEALEEDLSRQRARLEELSRQENQGKERLDQAQQTLDRLRDRLRRAQSDWEEALLREKERLALCRRREKEAEEAWIARRGEEQTLSSRLKILRDMAEVYEGYAKGVKTAMGQAKRGDLPGVLGPVGELFRVSARYTVALETALGGAMQYLLVEDEQAGKGVLEYIKRRDGGRATCLPLTALRPAVLREEGLEQEPGYLAVAADLVNCQEHLRIAARSLLGRTVVVDTLDNGISMAKKRNYRFPVVTLDGEILRPGGSMTGGSVNRRGGALSRGAEEELLTARLAKARTGLAAAAAERETARKEAAHAAETVERLQSDSPVQSPDAQTDQSSQEQQINEQRERLAGLQAEIRAFAPLLDQLTEQQAAALADRTRREELLTRCRQDNRQLEETIRELERQEETGKDRQTSLSQEIREQGERRLRLEQERTQTEREARQANETQLRLQRESAALEQKAMQASMEETRLLDRMWDAYGMTHEAARAVRQPLEDHAAASRRAGQLRNMINALGTVNLGAVEEFQRVEERYAYLNDQKTDVETAQRELEGIIDSITEEMREIFLREFGKIQAAFGETFADLFGGGKGALELEDPEDVLTCGIDIRVQPPGKTLRTISLLSGGERTLVAIALYFAILKVHPTPFCVVDEIEAALDEANGARFIRYLRAVSRSTQFVMITHRRETMEAADVLYGITMERQGVSRILKLDLWQVEELLGQKKQHS